MPSKIITCVLCGKRTREARSKYTVICTTERERKVFLGYRLRYNKELNVSLLNEQIHVTCYKSLVFDLEPVSIVKRTGRPTREKRFENFKSNTTSALAEITNNLSTNEESDRSAASSCTFGADRYHQSFETIEQELEEVNIAEYSTDGSINCANNTSDYELMNGDAAEIEALPSSCIEVSTSLISINDRLLNNSVSYTQPEENFNSSNLDNSIILLNDTREALITVESTESNADATICTFLEDDLSITTNGESADNDQFIDELETCEKMPKRSRKSRYFTRSLKRSNRSRCRNTSAPPRPTKDESCRLYSNGFDELCGWVLAILYSGSLISLIDVAAQYEKIMKCRKEQFTMHMLRTTCIRDRLKNKFGDSLHFEKISNYEGLYVALSDVSVYARLALSEPKIWHQPIQSEEKNRKENCELFIETIEQLRFSMKSHSYLFQSLIQDPSKLVNFDVNLFWKYVPLILKNFVGTLILSDESFMNLKKEFTYYDLMNKDMYIKSSKWLKIASCCFDLIYLQNGKNITPKHYFLGNELFRRERSKQLLRITNRMGYTPSYSTIVRLHRNVANNVTTAVDPHLLRQQNKQSSKFSHDFIFDAGRCIDTISTTKSSSFGHNLLTNETSINNWTKSFAFSALVASSLHEICGIENNDNTMDAHMECSPNRQLSDNDDLSKIMKKLRHENIFNTVNVKCLKLQSGLVIHHDIISNITSLPERGKAALTNFINERLISKAVPVDFPLKAIPLLKLSNADSYVPNSLHDKKKKSGSILSSKENFHTLVKLAEDEIYRLIIIAEQRNIKPLSTLFAHEFAPVSLSLCDSNNINLFNQQNNLKILDFLYRICPSSIYLHCPISTVGSAVVINGAELFETKPELNSKTIRDYASQLLKNNIQNLFKIYSRVDIVFNSSESKQINYFIKKNSNHTKRCIYNLKPDDKLESSFSKFVHSNEVALASCIKECWMEPDLIKLLPKDRLLVVGGPDEAGLKLQNGSLPVFDHILKTTQIEANTRIILHTNAIGVDEQQKTIFIESSETDVILLAIAFSSSIIAEHLIVKLFNMYTKKIVYIDVKSISNELRQKFIDPYVLLVLHALSGCSTTSFIRNVTKEKLFHLFFNDSTRYGSIVNLCNVPPPQDSIDTAELLLMECFPLASQADSLNELRALMASSYLKDKNRKNIVINLPPSTAAFYQHCLRCSRQLNIWFNSLESYYYAPELVHNGYEYSSVNNQVKIKWSSLAEHPTDYRLETCGECTTECTRCKCFKYSICCTIFCKCSQDTCSNRVTIHF
ncbi:unnamed protein product [Rotaria sp. Silwood2]|nr:unnamed protein product [Rotaria sp. Silwood2]